MTYLTLLAVGIGGFFGAISRAYISHFIGEIAHNFPYATLAVNVLGSFIIGIMFGIFFYYSVDIHIKSLVVTGFLGALTTFSTFAMENFLLLDDGNFKDAFINIFLNVFLTILFVAIGFYLTKFLFKNFGF